MTGLGSVLKRKSVVFIDLVILLLAVGMREREVGETNKHR